MIIVAGDIHGEFWAINNLVNSHHGIKIILQCGDFGWWPRAKNVGHWSVNNLKNKDVKIFWCDGNHEDFESLNFDDIEEVLPNCYYMPRGSIIELPDHRKVLFIGGGLSIDRNCRIQRDPNFGWFEEETISQKDIENLPDEEIEIVISHTAPESFDLKDYHKDYEPDPSRKALDYVLEKYRPNLWYFGHMHKYQKGKFKNTYWTALSAVGFGDRWWIKLPED